jgi:inosose dehydratase
VRLGYHLAPWCRDGHWEHFHRALDEISLTGWDGLEFSGQWVVDTFGRRPGDLRELLALHDLEMASCYFRPTFLPERRAQDEDLTRRVIAAAIDSGGKIILIDGGAQKPEGTTEDDYKRVAEVANFVGQQSRNAGLTCAWHQHWGTMFEWSGPFDRLMALTDPELVKFCPDTAQLMMGDFDVLETFRKYGPRIGYVHFKDLDHNHNWQVTTSHAGPSTWSDTGAYHPDSKWRFVELGRGFIDFPTLLAELRAVDYQGWIVDDFDYSAYPTREASTTLLRYLRNSLGAVGRRGHSGWAG